MILRSIQDFSAVCFFAALLSCSEKSEALFERLSPASTGIEFENRIEENDSINVIDFEYLYNGGGVGASDFNNDGLQDLFFTSSQGSCKLYLNRGDFKFDDVTDKANILTPYWNTGVSLVDINADGLTDIYLCTAHPRINGSSPNQLFINRGNDADGLPRFEEHAAEAGLADRGYSTQAAFFDYDNDGDLDCYILTNALESYNRAQPVGQKKDGTGKSTDRLYRNDGIGKNGIPKFTNVSAAAGINIEGWGLGIVVTDINNDGWQDVYCANDFQSNDLLWINNGNGTFTNRIGEYVKHQSLNSMGMDIADLNNDALPEIVNLDMMPEDNLRQKSMFSKPNYDLYQLQAQRGYQPQFVRNSLQLNRGVAPDGKPVFSEVGYFSGIYATDWSWAALAADFDNDGLRDLFVTNGYPKDVSNLDFAAYTAQSLIGFGPPKKNANEQSKKRLQKMSAMLGVKKPNVMFRNKGGLRFEQTTKSWGFDEPSFSNGAAYADLDNDGDLDLVVNNINDKAMVYRNRLRNNKSLEANFLRVRVHGGGANTKGFGCRITVYNERDRQFAEHTPYRGYVSSVEPIIHFGLGNNQSVDSLKIEWPGNKVQWLIDVKANQVIDVHEKDAEAQERVVPIASNLLFTRAHQNRNLVYKHNEADFVDFNNFFLLPKKYSQLGPALAAGDLNNDGRDDLVVGGSMRQRAAIFFQNKDGSFYRDSLPFKIEEDQGLLIFDADSDGDNDIYCVSGSSEFSRNQDRYQHRLYRNNGKGQFSRDSSSLLSVNTNGSCVVAADFDHDGDLDLFVGGRMSANKYPYAPRSYLLQNNGKEGFKDVTATLAPTLLNPGMVTAALWTDFDNDSWPDLMLVGEFMPIRIFHNQKGRFNAVSLGGWDRTTAGWWNSLVGADFDNDGDTDYIAGNLGLNSVFKASPSQPVRVYAKDYNKDGRIDPVMCRYIAGTEYPCHYRESLTDQITELKKSLNSYAVYGGRSVHAIFKQQDLESAYKLEACEMRSMYVENLGTGKFASRPLPDEFQYSPVFGLHASDINGDGNIDILGVGNDYAPESISGRYDASPGICMIGDGKGNFFSQPLDRGFMVPGDGKALVGVATTDNKWIYVASQNQDSLLAFESLAPAQMIRPKYDATSAVLHFKDGRKQKQEFYMGHGYYSQSSMRITISNDVSAVEISDYRGNVERITTTEIK